MIDVSGPRPKLQEGDPGIQEYHAKHQTIAIDHLLGHEHVLFLGWGHAILLYFLHLSTMGVLEDHKEDCLRIIGICQ